MRTINCWRFGTLPLSRNLFRLGGSATAFLQ